LCLNAKEYAGLNLEKMNISADKKSDEYEKPLIRPEQVPGLLESGWTMDDYHELRKQKERTFMIQC
jgi:histone acetyltransferase